MGLSKKLNQKDMSQPFRSMTTHFNKPCYLITGSNSARHKEDTTYSIQAITNVILNAVISGYEYILKIIKNYKRRRMEKRSKEEQHLNRTEFIALVLERCTISLHTFKRS